MRPGNLLKEKTLRLEPEGIYLNTQDSIAFEQNIQLLAAKKKENLLSENNTWEANANAFRASNYSNGLVQSSSNLVLKPNSFSIDTTNLFDKNRAVNTVQIQSMHPGLSISVNLKKEIESKKLKGVRLESLENGRPEMRATLDRAEQFLSLVSLLSAMLAAVAVAMAARRFMLRHVDACAMLRCLGLTQNQVTAMYLIEFLLLGLLGSLAGVIVGFAGHYVLLEWLGKLVSNDLPPASFLPALQGIATGLLLLVGFALPPILQLRNVPHNRVIRREQDAPQPLTLATNRHL